MTKLHVSPALALPEDAVTRTFVVYGGKGKGKTNFGSVLVEELAKRHLRFCVTDPLDVWWGLQHGRTKDEEGIDVAILGGAHGDIAIHPGAGELLADFVADEDVSTVIVMRHADGRMWTNGERIRFMTAFVRRLFARQGERRRPLMLVVDEAGRFVPQTAGKGDIQIAECIGAIEELVEWGRNVGIGCCLITQRSARMNKSVSELAECMVAFQTAGPNSVAAIVDWFGEHIERERQKELIGILRKLPVGRALVVSPEWLDFEGEAQIRLRETFDSSATPKAGGTLRAPGKARKPDLAKYQARMAEVAEVAKGEDPKALRAAITGLRKDIADRDRLIKNLYEEAERADRRAPKGPAKPIEVPVLRNGEANRLALAASKLEALTGRMEKVARDALAVAHSVHTPAVQVIGELERVVKAQSANTAGVTSRVAPDGAVGTEGRPRGSNVAPAVRAAERTSVAVGRGNDMAARAPRGGSRDTSTARPDPTATRTTGGATTPQQRILDALASLASIGVDPASKVQLALFAKASPSSSSYANNLGALRTRGLIAYPAGGAVSLTDEGHAAAAAVEVPTVDALHAFLEQLLSTPQWRIVRALIDVYPGALTKDELANRAEASATSSSFANNLGALRSLGLIDYPAPGQVIALPILFLEGTR